MRVAPIRRAGLPAALMLLAVPCVAFAEAPAYRLEVAPDAAEETVVSWARERCEEWDLPDAPLRAFRDDKGEVVAFASHHRGRPLIGRDLSSVRKSCAISFQARNSADPADFSDKSWIAATWTGDGRRVQALIHAEYHADKHAGACRFKDAMSCWYNVVTAARSSDGGRSFKVDEPRPLVAAPAFKQDVGQGRHRGFFNPSNIVEKDGAWYALIATTGGEGQKSGVCLFRTTDIKDATAWRAYDGTDFTIRALDPYREDVSQAKPCKPLKPLPTTVGSVTRHEASGQWLAIFHLGPDPSQGIAGGRVAYSWSSDLTRWSPLQTLMIHPTMWSKNCSDKQRYAYGALADPASPSRNFETTGDEAFLFMSKMRVSDCKVGPERDLVRVKVRFVPETQRSTP
ncbi:hypothetical protein DK26_25090 [Bosea sp. WAO]|uniref:hypothetical protein n=1 Tax=Bosea sp. WAO TaxID=406341 RepID=UPI0007484987|nr:hypothetical protein [Bosea sp. WAO]KUL93035.1 hypothetical protein DK26_25090 [Bosea sp. WAO]